MQWKSPSERTQLILLSPMIIPAAIILITIVIIFTPICYPFYKWNNYRRKQGWKRWFAWYPVYVDGYLDNKPSRWVWLETIDRRTGYSGKLYRWPEEEKQ